MPSKTWVVLRKKVSEFPKVSFLMLGLAWSTCGVPAVRSEPGWLGWGFFYFFFWVWWTRHKHYDSGTGLF